MSTVDETHRFRLDDLRRHAAGLGAAAGLARDRAAALAGHLLWYDAAGAPGLGIARLPDWLDRIARGEVDPHAEAVVGHELPATAVVDGRRGPAPLILARAAGIAAEKARELGVGVVRVVHVGPIDSAAEIAAEVAVGPMVAALLGPRPSWTVALPSADGLPALFDTDLAGGAGTRPEWFDRLAPWASALATEGGWLILALAVTALEPLTTFHERTSSTFSALPDDTPAALRPGPWAEHRRAVRERGVPLDPDTLAALRRHAERLGVEPIA